MYIHIEIRILECIIPINAHNQVIPATPAHLHYCLVDLQQAQDVNMFSFSPVCAHICTHKYTHMHLLKILKLFNENKELDRGNVSIQRKDTFSILQHTSSFHSWFCMECRVPVDVSSESVLSYTCWTLLVLLVQACRKVYFGATSLESQQLWIATLNTVRSFECVKCHLLSNKSW